MPKYQSEVVLPVDCETAFAWHERTGAFERLNPPWENVEVESADGGIRDGGKVVLKIPAGPFGVRWVARHEGYEPPYQFVDVQESGPFRSWRHVHAFRTHGERRCLLRDEVVYEAPTPNYLDKLANGRIRQKLDAMFRYRHRVTASDLRFHNRYSQSKKTIAVTGAGGLIGNSLSAMLTTGGHDVVELTRSAPSERGPQIEERQYDPMGESLDPAILEDCDAVIHLAGEPIMGRWDEEKKRKIRDSRVNSTRIISEAMAKSDSAPKTLVVASAIGFYGDQGDTILKETDDPGTDFLAGVAREWEAAADPARDAGCRVSHVRLGIVLSPAGGALGQMLLPFKLGGGVQVGDGTQWWSWITIDDAAAMFAWAALDDAVSGPVNAAAGTATNRHFTEVLSKILNRPTWPSLLRVPGFGAKLALGEMADALLLASTRVVPERTKMLGYEFRYPDLEDALRHVLGRD